MIHHRTHRLHLRPTHDPDPRHGHRDQPRQDPRRGAPPATAWLLVGLLLAVCTVQAGSATARPVDGDGGPRAATDGPLAVIGSVAGDTAAGAGPSPGRGRAPRGSRSSAAVVDPAGVWPLRPQPTVVRRFDPPALEWGAGHRGVDLLGRPGQRVRAAAPGTVTFTGRIAGRGVVVVGHGDTRTTYEPVAASVSAGQEVAAGEVIGRLELLGSHCLPRSCLHWGLLRGETYLDPLTLVGLGPVRLIPWSGLPAPQARGWAWR